MPARYSASLISNATKEDSASPLREAICTLLPLNLGANFINDLARDFRSSRLMVRGCTIASRRVFSSRNADASLSSADDRWFTRETNWLLFSRNSAFLLRNSLDLPRSLPLTLAIFTPAPSSPATPIAISKTLAISTLNLRLGGLAGDRVMPTKAQMANASHSSCQSCRINQSSIKTPTTTKAENIQTQGSHQAEELSRALIALSRADTSLSNAETELSKAEGSVGRLETDWTKAAKITIAFLLIPVGYGLCIIILADRAQRSYKKSI